ncbi:MAG: xanthine dehydrogenase family protein molybdopterin-binding subunit, partial [Planctomycetes bacterium]|nr:xanthine dehydrogenase family protein molybdopterin-binding subunit [Planctomycetota bacterium]
MKSEPDYLALDFNDIEVLPLLDRREFLKSLGAGIFVFVSLGELLIAGEAGGADYRIRPQEPEDFNAFLRIAEDGQVTCFLGKVEMGQGIYTSMAQLLAEELDVAVESVEMVLSDTDQCPYDMGTWGSMSVRYLGPTLRKAGAEARAVLLTLAARELGVKAAKLKTENGFVMVSADSNRKLSYGALAKGQKIQRVVGADAVIKDAAKHQVVGTSITHTDANAKVTGKAIYAGDVRLPGMLYARILRPPSHASKLESVRTSGAEKIEGAKVIHEGDFVAVLHPTPDGAEAALRRIRAEYETPDASVNHETIFDALLANAPSERKLDNGGDLAVGEKAAEHLVEASFKDGYVAHAPMETHTAVASVKSDSATVWASTQNPFGVRSSIARILELDVSK